MSYIRSGSNPESLYIFGGPSGCVEIYRPEKPGEPMMVPYETFHKLGRRFWSDFDFGEPLEVDGAKLEEVAIPTGEENPFETPNYIPADHKVRLSYGGEHVDMWWVTACYIFRRFETPAWSELTFWQRLKWALFNR